LSLNRNEKAAVVADVGLQVARSQTLALAEYRGLTVAHLDSLRRQARDKGVYLHVLKNTLARRAVAGTPFEVAQETMVGPLIYGFSEDAVAAANAGASIVRIGWQIDATLPGHNMLVELDGWQARDGRIGASRAWRPACSFVDDTAAVLIDLIERPQPGVVPIDSNAAEGHSFEAIVRALQCRYARWHWQIAPNDDYRHDQRQIGGEQRVPGLSARLELGQ